MFDFDFDLNKLQASGDRWAALSPTLPPISGFGSTASQQLVSPASQLSGNQNTGLLDQGANLIGGVTDWATGKDATDLNSLGQSELAANRWGGIGSLLSGAGAIGNMFTGMKQMDMAEEQMDFQKDMAMTNLNNQRKQYNTSLRERRRRFEEASGNTDPKAAVAKYMKANGL